MTELSVSILSADLANLAAETADSMVCGADMVHFDVMDGHFVPNITYGAPVLKCLKKAVPEAFYDVHLMISDPARFGGQKFIPTTVSRVAAIKAECNRRGVSPRIEVDGGINTETASLCAQAGASVLVMGSAFFKAQDRTALAKQVRAL